MKYTHGRFQEGRLKRKKSFDASLPMIGNHFQAGQIRPEGRLPKKKEGMKQICEEQKT